MRKREAEEGGRGGERVGGRERCLYLHAPFAAAEGDHCVVDPMRAAKELHVGAAATVSVCVCKRATERE